MDTMKPPATGIVCPFCKVNRGDPTEWLKYCLDEFYDLKQINSEYFKLFGTTKNALIRALQSISALGHFHDMICRERHPKRRHDCLGMIEVGVYQSVELLNRGVFHLISGSPSVGFPALRMALEVGIRSVFEQFVYEVLSGGLESESKPAEPDPKLDRYLIRCKEVLKGVVQPNFQNCAYNLISVAWPDPRSKGDLITNPISVGWESVLKYLAGSKLLAARPMLSKEVTGLYGELSCYVHQRKDMMEATFRQTATYRLRRASQKHKWIIRGIESIPTNATQLSMVPRVVDTVMATSLLLHCALSYRLHDIEEHKSKFDDPDLFPNTTVLVSKRKQN